MIIPRRQAAIQRSLSARRQNSSGTERPRAARIALGGAADITTGLQATAEDPCPVGRIGRSWHWSALSCGREGSSGRRSEGDEVAVRIADLRQRRILAFIVAAECDPQPVE